MISGVDHIGIAVNSIEEARKLYSDIFGFEFGDIEEGQGIRTVFISAGNTKFELLEPVDPESGLAKFIERRGEGVNHLALEVSNIEDALRTLKEKGIPLVDEKPRKGSAGTRVAFLHPKGTKGVAIQLLEH